MLRIAADVNELAAVRHFIREEALRAGAGREVTDDMVQAVDELATNSIVHGYRGARGQIEVEVEVDVDARAMVVHLRDQAPAFDPTTLEDPDTTLALERRPLGGMGVYLSKQLTDGLIYRQTSTGNELTLTKRFSRTGGSGEC